MFINSFPQFSWYVQRCREGWLVNLEGGILENKFQVSPLAGNEGLKSTNHNARNFTFPLGLLYRSNVSMVVRLAPLYQTFVGWDVWCEWHARVDDLKVLCELPDNLNTYTFAVVELYRYSAPAWQSHSGITEQTIVLSID